MSFGNTSPNISFGNITANISQGNITSTLGGATMLADFLMVGGGGNGGQCANSPSNYGPAYESAGGGGGSGEVRWSLGAGTPTHTTQAFTKGSVYNIVVGGTAGTTSIVGPNIDIRAGGGGEGGYGGGTSNGTPPAVPDPTNGGYLGGIGAARGHTGLAYYGQAINASGNNAGGVSSSITGTSTKYGASWPAARLVTQNAYNNGTHVAIQDASGYPSYYIYDGYYDISYNLSGTYTATGTYGTAGYEYYGRGGLGGASYYHSQLGNRRMTRGSGAGGVVIIRFLTAGNTYVTTGATATTDGDYTVLTWTSGTHTLKFT